MPEQAISTNRLDTSDLLTPEQLAERLQVKVTWVFEQTRQRAKVRNKNPLPGVRLGKYLRFSWTAVSDWLVRPEPGKARGAALSGIPYRGIVSPQPLTQRVSLGEKRFRNRLARFWHLESGGLVGGCNAGASYKHKSTGGDGPSRHSRRDASPLRSTTDDVAELIGLSPV
jgi:hypothetical protein